MTIQQVPALSATPHLTPMELDHALPATIPAKTAVKIMELVLNVHLVSNLTQPQTDAMPAPQTPSMPTEPEPAQLVQDVKTVMQQMELVQLVLTDRDSAMEHA